MEIQPVHQGRVNFDCVWQSMFKRSWSLDWRAGWDSSIHLFCVAGRNLIFCFSCWKVHLSYAMWRWTCNKEKVGVIPNKSRNTLYISLEKKSSQLRCQKCSLFSTFLFKIDEYSALSIVMQHFPLSSSQGVCTQSFFPCPTLIWV